MARMISMVAVMFIFFITGCQNTKRTSVTKGVSSLQKTQSEKYIKQNERLKQCQSQLQALKIVNPLEYTRMQNAFDHLMSSAAQYNGMRKIVDENTQDTVDSLYHYRANQLCTRIAQTLMESLTSKGEARP